MTEYIYEVRDTTDDEMYYPLGVFLSLKDAIEAIEQAESPDASISEYAQDYERITVRAQKIGWSGHGRTVFEIRRDLGYGEDQDEREFWQRISR